MDSGHLGDLVLMDRRSKGVVDVKCLYIVYPCIFVTLVLLKVTSNPSPFLVSGSGRWQAAKLKEKNTPIQ